MSAAPPAAAGWNWLKQGFALFRKRPAQVTFLFTTYLFSMLLLGIIPYIGQALPLFCAPTFSAIFMTACAQIDRNGFFDPKQLREVITAPVLRNLLLLGGLYLLAAALAVAASYLIDGGLFLKLMMGQRDAEASQAQRASVLGTMLVLGLAYIPVFWYAPPLIAWQKMSFFKAMFYSFFSVIHAWKAFVVYFLGWILVGALLPSFIVGLLALALGKGIAMLIMFLATIVLTVVMYCSFYPTYVDVFGKPDLS